MAGQRIAGCRVGGGTRSGGAWLRLRHATSTRPSSPPSYLARLASSRLAASTASPPHHRCSQRPPPLTWIFCSPRCLSLSLFFSQRHRVFLPFPNGRSGIFTACAPRQSSHFSYFHLFSMQMN